MITLLAFIFTIGILVTVHEYGHFQVAKWCNVRVLKFSIGFGLPLWRRKAGRDQTEFIIAAIPLGGYVKMLDEREFDEANLPTGYSEVDLKRAFNRQSVFKRIAIEMCIRDSFTTDTAAALRGMEMNAEIVIKATKVDGIYTEDPKSNPDAMRYKTISFDEAISKNLKVMDATALTLCRDQKLPISVFSIFKQGALKKVIMGEDEGTMVTP